ncbi:MAG: DNA-binding protein, partial [Acidimicrobiales bacterium]
MIQAIGTYLPPWGTDAGRRPGDDEDAVTMAVAAGLQAIASAPDLRVARVVLVSRDLPLLEGGNGAALLAGLSLPATTEVREELGGAPAALEAVGGAAPGTLVIGADVSRAAGAAAALVGVAGADVRIAGRVNRSLPVVTRDAAGRVTDYADPRLVRELGLHASLGQLDLAGKAAAVAGISAKDGAPLSDGSPTALPTLGASAA